MAFVGFAGCVEYGTPYAEFIVSGKVTDTEYQELKDIRVVVPRVDHHQRATSNFLPGQQIISEKVCDTVYTKENGHFEYKYTGFGTIPLSV
jgi:putative lipoprotein (rSAM/lipoprotein system)